MFSKLDKEKKLSIFVIGTLVLGTTVVSANDDNTLSLSGKVKYTSQNLLQESGTKLDGYKVSYVDSVEIWKYADQVKNIIISDNKTKPEEYEYRYDLTTTGSKRIYGYLVENGNSKTPYDLYIVSNGVIYAPANSTGLFSFPNVETIKGLEYVEFDNTTNMTAMFMNNEKLKNLNTSAINTSNVTNTSYMFNGCDNLNVTEKNFNLAKVTNKKYMFNQDLIDIVKLNTTSDKNTDFSATPVTGKYMIESTKNDTNPVYYYRGAVTDNNVLFGGYCWKMVRTTDTGGVKMIYNGTPNNIYTPVGSAEYVNITNASSNPFEFNSSTLKWTSKNKSHNSSSSVTFSIVNAGSYVINYDISSEYNFDKAYFYKDGTLLKQVSGTENGTVNFGYLTAANKIQVKYSKDGSVNNGSDNVVFYVAKGTETKPTCNNTGIASQLASTSAFNSNNNSPAYVGYMYGTIYTSAYKALKNQTDTYLYGNNVSWNGTNYTLTGPTMSSSKWATDRNTLATKYHYTCFNKTGVCESVNYINFFGSADNAYYLTLKDGKNIENIKEDMFSNITDSKIKTTIDTWYKENMTSYTNMLEDTIWCNDRTLISGTLLSKDTNSTDSSLFATYERNMHTFKPSVSCVNKRDSFTVKNNAGNGNLTYPVGLLTADEMTLAGSGNKSSSSTSYLYNGQNQQSMSPSYYYSYIAYGFYQYSSGTMYSKRVENELGVRPAISLKVGTDYVSGTGTVNDPYIVE